jgi:hypothetical protein
MKYYVDNTCMKDVNLYKQIYVYYCTIVFLFKDLIFLSSVLNMMHIIHYILNVYLHNKLYILKNNS